MILILVFGCIGCAQSTAGTNRVHLFSMADLEKTNQLYRAHDHNAVIQVNNLLKQADSLLTQGPWSVTFDKKKTAPGNNPHDYLSQAPYWWPDSSKADGKPYIRKDGRRNPEIYELHDAAQMEKMASAVKKLALAYHFSKKATYAKKAGQLLKTWFIDPATAMNPNLNYAQYVPGVNEGRGIGIIETNRLLPIPDAVTLLQNGLDANLVNGLKDWFKAYTQWLLTSKNGKAEQKELNNHGTWFDVQVVVYTLFSGDEATARKEITDHTIPRIAKQFTADGRQPLELARTRAWDYSNMNLMAWYRLAFIAQQLNIDLYNKTVDGSKGIKTALEFLLPYAAGEQAWPYQEIGGYEYGNIRRMVHTARVVYPDLKLKAFDRKFPEGNDPLMFLF
ncbi:alginate lyase family protein [Mucilaginibacter terrenus]|uniref:alginate lyase family protein n=1 Tax=Mucilaginibacter terrenus TaxID=2482727 RepID=UPI0014034C85|nr:alginate lyase family protein [Mucilaginibacter terrenus]